MLASPVERVKLSREKRREDENPLADLRERISALETHVEWMKKKLDSIDNRTWWILGSVVALGVVAILISVLKP